MQSAKPAIMNDNATCSVFELFWPLVDIYSREAARVIIDQHRGMDISVSSASVTVDIVERRRRHAFLLRPVGQSVIYLDWR